jgi:tetratricopeptide (TPR) repeat protein
LRHRNIIGFYEYGVDGDYQYIAMEYIVGQSLEEKLSNGPLSILEALEIMEPICEGLAHAHKHQVLHRDIKPANIMLVAEAPGSQGITVKLIDFGLASFNEPRCEQKLTDAGHIVGTAAYVSPEQCLGLALDARTDIYSLGCVFHECLTGTPPFEAPHTLMLLQQHVRDLPEILQTGRAGVPECILEILDKSLAKDPAARYSNAEELLCELRTLKKKLASRSPDVGKSSERRVKHVAVRGKLGPGRMIAAFSLVAGLCLGLFWGYDHSTNKKASSGQDLHKSDRSASPRLALVEARNLMEKREYNAAAQRFEDALARAGSHPDGKAIMQTALIGLADNARMTRNYSLSVHYYSRALVAMNKMPYSVDYYRTLHDLAGTYFLLKDYERAGDLYRQSAEYNAAHPERAQGDYIGAANCYFQRGMVQKALQSYSEITKKCPAEESPWQCLGMGLCYAELHQRNAAVKYLEKARGMFLAAPNGKANGLAETDNALALQYIARGGRDKEKARLLLRETLAIDGSKLDALIQRDLEQYQVAAKELLGKEAAAF